MIKETIKIGDHNVEFACSAGTLKRYRDAFNEDLFGQMTKLTSDEPDIEVLAKLSYAMAKQAGEAKDYEEWLDQFDLLDFMNAIPAITKLWSKNMVETSKPKKK